MGKFIAGKAIPKKPWLTAFFNNWGGSLFSPESAFDFENVAFINYKGCPYGEELEATRWGTERGSGVVVGYSKDHKIGFIPVDLSSMPENERQFYVPPPEHFAILKEVIDQIDPPPVAAKRDIVEDD